MTGRTWRAGLALVLVAACTGGCASGRGSVTRSASSETLDVAAQATSAASEAGAGAVDREAAAEKWRSWRPSDETVMPRYSDAEAEQIRRDFWDVNRPEGAEGLPVPDLVRWSEGEATDAARCMTEQGFPARAEGMADSLEYRAATQAQEAQQEVVAWECQARYSPRVTLLAPRTEQTERYVYAYYTEFYLPCMKGYGIDLYRDGIPSEDVWVAKSLAGEAELWVPYSLSEFPPVSDERPRGLTDEELEYLCPWEPPYAP